MPNGDIFAQYAQPVRPSVTPLSAMVGGFGAGQQAAMNIAGQRLQQQAEQQRLQQAQALAPLIQQQAKIGIQTAQEAAREQPLTFAAEQRTRQLNQHLIAHQMAAARLSGDQAKEAYVQQRLADLAYLPISERKAQYQIFRKDAMSLGVEPPELPQQYDSSVEDLITRAAQNSPRAKDERAFYQKLYYIRLLNEGKLGTAAAKQLGKQLGITPGQLVGTGYVTPTGTPTPAPGAPAPIPGVPTQVPPTAPAAAAPAIAGIPPAPLAAAAAPAVPPAPAPTAPGVPAPPMPGIPAAPGAPAVPTAAPWVTPPAPTGAPAPVPPTVPQTAPTGKPITGPAAAPGATLPPSPGITITPAPTAQKAYETQAAKDFSKAQQSAADTVSKAQEAIEDIDTFVGAAGKIPTGTGPWVGHLAWASPEGQLARKAQNRLALNLLSMQKFGRVTNKEMAIVQKGTLSYYMDPEAWQKLAPQLRAISQRNIEYSNFLNAASNAGIRNVSQAQSIWNKFMQEHPIINQDGSVNAQNVSGWQNYLSPQALKGELETPVVIPKGFKYPGET
jgi:hypothetical protein